MLSLQTCQAHVQMFTSCSYLQDFYSVANELSQALNRLARSTANGNAVQDTGRHSGSTFGQRRLTESSEEGAEPRVQLLQSLIESLTNCGRIGCLDGGGANHQASSGRTRATKIDFQRAVIEVEQSLLTVSHLHHLDNGPAEQRLKLLDGGQIQRLRK